MDPTPHEVFIRESYALARDAVAQGNHPFGALLVHEGVVVLRAGNTVTTQRDCTCHAELNLVSRGCRELAPEVLAACTLYTSTEPCAMCSGAIAWARIRAVVYGCSAEGLKRLSGEAFVIPCREVLGRSGQPVSVVGPLLEDEGLAIHAAFW
jgi:tRNA(Arg) A34 adenosine deaminase TadA